MDFQLESTDELAQIGTISTDHATLDIPGIIFLELPKIPYPTEAKIILNESSNKNQKPVYFIKTNASLKKKEKQMIWTVTNPLFYPHIIPESIQKDLLRSYPPDNHTAYVLSSIPEKINANSYKKISLFIISHGLQLYKNPKDLVSYLHHLRSNISPDQLVYFPSIATPQNIPILLSLGIDLIDSTQAIIAARNKTLLFPEGPIKQTSLKINPCHCPYCLSKKLTPTSLTFQDILFHNYQMMVDELQKTIHAITNESLREFIGLRMNNSPHLTNIIRYAEMDAYGILEKKTPRHKKSLLKATQLDALQRPEIRRFQHEVITNYRKPDQTSILVLLPCSAKKPYSFSKSHKKFIRVIQSTPFHNAIHELIITSPIGIVPRELELKYPASSYDITVTGDWFEDEKKMILTLLKKYLINNQYETIINHLPEPLNQLIQDAFPDFISTHCSTTATSHKALENLREKLTNHVGTPEKLSRKQRIKQNISSIASFQFTKPLADQLMKDTIIKGKYPFLKIFDSSQTQLGMLTDTRGMISLTLPGAQRISLSKRFFVEIASSFTLKGSVFAPGVINADPLIRKGDEVIIIQNDTLIAVGVAHLNGEDMIQRTSGKAVDVRHIVH